MVVAWVIVNFKAPSVTIVANGNAGRRSISSALAEFIIIRPCPVPGHYRDCGQNPSARRSGRHQGENGKTDSWGYGARDRRVFAVAFVLRTARFATAG